MAPFTTAERTEQAILKKLQAHVAFTGDQSSLLELLVRKNGVLYWIDEQAQQDEMIRRWLSSTKMEFRLGQDGEYNQTSTSASDFITWLNARPLATLLSH